MTATFRLRLLAACLVVVGVAFVQDPGYLVADTKLDLAVAPADFLGRALHLWDGEGAFGQLQNQAYGYLWPMGPFFLLGGLLDLPGWVVQRLWVGLVMAVALSGAARVTRALGVRSDLACLTAGFAFALSPRLLTTLGPISIEAWPSALAPWVLLPLVRGATVGSPRRAAALSALAVAMVGGVNAAATFAVLPLGVVWLLTRTPGPRRRALMLWWPLFTLLGTLWWLVPLFVMGAYSPPFLDYIETTSVTTFPTTLFDVLRGTSNWVPYVDPASRAGNDLITTATLVLNSGVVLLLGVAGLAHRRTPHRSFLVLSVLLGVLMVGAGHTGAVEGWWAADARGLLDGALAPLRNVHKFDPVLRLPLVVGLALVLDRVLARGRDDRADVDTPQASGAGPQARLERVNRTAVVGMALAVVAGAALPAALGRVTPAGATLGVPSYWEQTAAWLAAEDDTDPGGTDLLVPGSAFGEYVWGGPRDEPLQWLADAPWAVRNVIPLTRPGNIRMLDAIEERLAQGEGSAALVAYLQRAGVEHLVVRNDLARDGDVPDPVLVHAALADSPGLERVTTFGPDVGGGSLLDEVDGERVLVNGGWQSLQAAVEVWAVPDGGRLAVGTEQPVVVAGGPEDLLDLSRLGLLDDTPTVLAADGAEGAGALVGDDGGLEAPVVLTDGLRARERGFARLHDGASAALTPGDVRRTGNPARDYLPADAGRWSTTVRLEGARAVSASSSASDATAVGGTRRGALPYAAVDGDPATAWETAPLSSSSAWWRLDLEQPLAGGTVRLEGGPGATDDQLVRVRTEAGVGEEVRLGPGDVRETALPAGETTWVQVEDASGVAGRALSLAEVALPGVDVRRRLVLPTLPESWGDPAAVVLRRDRDARRGCVVVDGDVRCVAGRDRDDEEAAGLSRAFTLDAASAWDTRLSLVPRGGPELDRLALRDQPVSVDVSSTAVPDPRGGALAAVDGDPGTTWTADPEDLRPALELSWLGQRTLRRIAVDVDEDAAVRAPTRLRLIWPDGQRTVDLEDGRARLAPIRTDRLRLEVLEADGTTSLDFAAAGIDLGVGISELDLGGVEYLPLALPTEPVAYPCGTGPDVVVDGETLPTALEAAPADLARGEVVDGRLCGGATLDLPAGEVLVDAPSSAALAVDALVLTDPAQAALPLGAGEQALPWRRTPDTRTVEPAAGDALVVLRQNANTGWRASQEGVDLTPVVVDGWQQGWLLPDATAPSAATGAATGTATGAEPEAAPVEAVFAPDRAYRAGLLAGLIGLVALLVLVLVGRRRGWPDDAAPLTDRRVPGALLAGAGLLGAGAVAGWPGVVVAVVVTVLVRGAAGPLERRGAGDALAWAVAVPVLVVAGAYAVTPWGSSDGWAGEAAWPVYLMLVPLVGLLVAGPEGVRLPGRLAERLPTSPRRRIAGRSTRR